MNPDDHPINGVSWFQINDFAQWVGARLPTEAEWEYAARGGRGNIYAYSGSNNPAICGWYDMNSNQSTHPVKQKEKNDFGLYDMSGNVWEWVLDEAHMDYNEAPTDGSAWCSMDDCSSDDPSHANLMRGGSWNSDAYTLRVVFRVGLVPRSRIDDLGGRLAR